LLAGQRDMEAALQLLRPHYDALRDRSDARGVVLDLTQALSDVMMRLSMDFRDMVDHRLQLAELLGDGTAIGDSHISLAVYYVNRGLHGLSRTLFTAAAD